MRWKFIVPTRTCLLFVAFWWKEVVFCRLSYSSSPLPFPDRSFFNRFKRSAAIQWLGRRMQCATMGVICTSGEIAIAMQPAPAPTTAMKSRLLLLLLVALNCCNCAAGRAHKAESSGLVGNLIRQRHSRCRILSQNVQLSTNDGAFARRLSSASCTTWVRSLQPPKSIFFTCPIISYSWKQEKPTTTTLNSKKET